MLILVTGADGQLGRALRQARGGALRAAAPEWAFAGREQLDVTSEASVERFFAAHRPAVVVNCAAFTDVDGAENQRDKAMAVNFLGARNLAEACRAAGAAMVHVSTDFVFDGLARVPYIESDAPAPVNFYGESKLAGERAVAASGCRGAIVRTSWLWSGEQGFPAAILRKAATQKEIKVVADQVGTPTAAKSLAAALMRMVAEFAAAGNSTSFETSAELFHFCDGPVLSRAEWARAIIRDAGLDCRVIEVSSDEFPGAARPHFSALDPTKFHTKYGR